MKAGDLNSSHIGWLVSFDMHQLPDYHILHSVKEAGTFNLNFKEDYLFFTIKSIYHMRYGTVFKIEDSAISITLRPDWEVQ